MLTSSLGHSLVIFPGHIRSSRNLYLQLCSYVRMQSISFWFKSTVNGLCALTLRWLWPANSAYSTTWLIMSWQSQEPRHLQPAVILILFDRTMKSTYIFDAMSQVRLYICQNYDIHRCFKLLHIIFLKHSWTPYDKCNENTKWFFSVCYIKTK